MELSFGNLQFGRYVNGHNALFEFRVRKANMFWESEGVIKRDIIRKIFAEKPDVLRYVIANSKLLGSSKIGMKVYSKSK